MLLGALLAAEVACLVLAVLLARASVQSSSPLRRPVGGRPFGPGAALPASAGSAGPLAFVALLALALANEVVIEVLHRCLFTDPLHPVTAAIQRFGWPARLAYHLETALVLGWPCGLAAACWRVFSPSRVEWRWSGRLLLGAWLGVLGGLVVAFPVTSGRTAAVLHVWELASVVAAGVAVARGWRRPWGAPAVALAGVLVPVEVTIALIGPFARDVFADWNTLARWPYAIGFSVLAAILLAFRLRLTPRR